MQNLHTHTIYCDGADSPALLVEAAAAEGFSALGFSGHDVLAGGEDFCMSCDGKKKYIDEIKRLQKTAPISVFLGLETDALSPWERDGFDFIIGSAHGVKKDGKIFWADLSAEDFKGAVDAFSGVYNFIEAYFCMVEKAVSLKPDILGHIDLITKYNTCGVFFDETDSRYLDCAKRALQKALDNDIIIEINTGAMARGMDRLYPGIELLRTIKQKNGRIMLSSDCHDRNKLSFRFYETLKLLEDEGFSYLTVLTPDGFRQQSLEEYKKRIFV